MTTEIGHSIGNKLRKFLAVEQEAIGWGSALRIRVLLYVRQPLVRVLKLQTSTGATQAVSMTYECLPNFCFTCGILAHIAKYCTKPFEDGFANSGSNPQYGAWLRPQPPRSTYRQWADQPSGDRSNGLAGRKWGNSSGAVGGDSGF
ncbi:hypothetical protein Salat_0853600 [Sesamum alatum]|uniref:Zinc knuckle CX2CX4HX4C domain-containing protein n=1 Tax=Sesamum alatum TaxID=300844 RepID=A0AAE1YIX2_9LAMI|nr:hypothetical protein Salat_0853600 [Sesamum alatum]